MILQRLAEHYDRIVAKGSAKIAPSGYSTQKVSFCIVLESDGRLNQFEDLLEQEGKLKRPRMMILPGQSKPSGRGINPCFLWDNAEYLLGYAKDSSRQERARSAFEAFRRAHIVLEQKIAQPEFSAVCAFLRAWSPEMASGHEELQTITSHFGVFRLAGEMRFVHEQIAPRADAQPATDIGMCLVSGEVGPTARLHEPKIKGVSGAQTSGALLVSFNATAFTSYGKEQSFNAPVGTSTVFKYANALNHLLSLRDRRVHIGDATVIYWADHKTVLEDAFAHLFSGGVAEEPKVQEDQERLEQAKVLLSQMREGTQNTKIQPDEVDTRFFILGLSPNASRLSVRIWVEADAAEMQRRLSGHVRDFTLKGGRDDLPLPIWRIVAATGRAEKDPKGRLKSYDVDSVSPQLAGDLARSILTGAPYPQSLLATMVRRIRSDGDVGFARVSAIKACLVRNSRLRDTSLEVPMELDPDRADVAYRCGRLFALLEKAQTDSAGGELNSTIKDRYFSSASTMPGIVFPRLFRLNGHHLNKLPAGTKVYYERLIGGVMAAPFDFPKQLSLADQGKFIVGYFQQRQELYTSRKDKPSQENA